MNVIKFYGAQDCAPWMKELLFDAWEDCNKGVCILPAGSDARIIYLRAWKMAHAYKAERLAA